MALGNPERDRIVEYEEWKAGDVCWTVPYGEVRPVKCEIVEFFPNDNIAPAAAITVIPGGKFRVGRRRRNRWARIWTHFGRFH